MKVRSIEARVATAACAAVLSLVGVACYRPVQLAASTRPVVDVARVGERVEGWSCQPFLLGAVPLGGGNTIQEAVAEAKRAGDADTLVEVTVDERRMWLLVFSNRCTVVSGVPVHG